MHSGAVLIYTLTDSLVLRGSLDFKLEIQKLFKPKKKFILFCFHTENRKILKDLTQVLDRDV